MGSGQGQAYSNIGKNVFSWVLKERKENKRIISHRTLREKALSLGVEEVNEMFKASDNWINNFINKNNLSVRRITIGDQEDNMSLAEIKLILEYYFVYYFY